MQNTIYIFFYESINYWENTPNYRSGKYRQLPFSLYQVPFSKETITVLKAIQLPYSKENYKSTIYQQINHHMDTLS